MNSILDRHEEFLTAENLIFPVASGVAGGLLETSRKFGIFQVDPKDLRTRFMSANDPEIDPELNPMKPGSFLHF